MLIDQLENLRRNAIARARAFRTAAGLSRSGLAIKAGLHKNTLRHMDCANWSPPDKTLRAIEAVIPPDFEAAGVEAEAEAA